MYSETGKHMDGNAHSLLPDWQCASVRLRSVFMHDFNNEGIRTLK